MFVAANPAKARSDADKKEMAAKYKPGEQVLPKVNIRKRTKEERRADEEDRRLLEEVRERSLREAGGGPALPPRPRRRGDSRSGDERSRTSRARSSDTRQRRTTEDGSRRREDGPRSSADQLAVDGEGRQRERRSESRQRRVEHQSSLRSLIGSSEMSERDIEKEIEEFARQIQEEGLLDGLDLDNIDLSRNDELSRRITAAYRRRQRERSRQEPSQRSNASGHSSATRLPESSQADRRPRTSDRTARSSSHNRTTSRSTSATDRTEDRPRPPPSTSANLEVREPARRPRRRTASGGRSATTPVFSTNTETRPAARSQTDLSIRTHSSDPNSLAPSPGEGRSSSMTSVHVLTQTPVELPASNNGSHTSFANRMPMATLAIPNATTSTPAESSSSRTARAHRPADLAIVHSAGSSPLTTPSTPGHQRTRSQLYAEPSISCSRCNRTHIEYEVHYNCGLCSDGHWNLCLDCYRAGKGCLYWFGFGYGAWKKWEKTRKQGDDSVPMPHMLNAGRYIPPTSTPGGADGRKTLTHDDPRLRLETGTFCAKCLAWTNDCFWRCDVCNEGDWGFCNDCVNQGRCCTHMLLPLAHEAAPLPQSRPRSPRSPGRPPTASLLTGPQASNIGPFKPLTFTTRCDVCQDPIQPSQIRYHCFSCVSTLVPGASAGDYDICTPCYGNLVAQGQISGENGHSGWRRCLNGHRMVIVGFADGKIGQWRYVERDLVGGLALRSDPVESPEHQGLQKWSWRHRDEKGERLVTREVTETAPSSLGMTTYSQDFPLEGGSGMRAHARWAWYPKTGADDELLFPRGAEVREIEDVNGDWFFGSYMGKKGLFPAPYVKIEEEPQ